MGTNYPGNGDDLEKLFLDEPGEQPVPEAGATGEPTLPTSSVYRAYGSPHSFLPIRQQLALDAAAVRDGGSRSMGGLNLKFEPSTVLESDAASLYRELSGIWRNIALVCNPFLKQDDVTAMLQHWDLWGPLIFNLLLACTLALRASDKEMTFCVVFIVVIAGAILLTSNVVLLGGSVSLLQSISLLGYCMFPLDLAAILCTFGLHAVIKFALIAVAIFWSMRASVPFVAGSVGPHRHALAVYPIALMYVVLGWLIFITT